MQPRWQAGLTSESLPLRESVHASALALLAQTPEMAAVFTSDATTLMCFTTRFADASGRVAGTAATALRLLLAAAVADGREADARRVVAAAAAVFAECTEGGLSSAAVRVLDWAARCASDGRAQEALLAKAGLAAALVAAAAAEADPLGQLATLELLPLLAATPDGLRRIVSDALPCVARLAGAGSGGTAEADALVGPTALHARGGRRRVGRGVRGA